MGASTSEATFSETRTAPGARKRDGVGSVVVSTKIHILELVDALPVTAEQTTELLNHLPEIRFNVRNFLDDLPAPTKPGSGQLGPDFRSSASFKDDAHAKTASGIARLLLSCPSSPDYRRREQIRDLLELAQRSPPFFPAAVGGLVGAAAMLNEDRAPLSNDFRLGLAKDIGEHIRAVVESGRKNEKLAPLLLGAQDDAASALLKLASRGAFDGRTSYAIATDALKLAPRESATEKAALLLVTNMANGTEQTVLADHGSGSHREPANPVEALADVLADSGTFAVLPRTIAVFIK